MKLKIMKQKHARHVQTAEKIQDVQFSEVKKKKLTIE